jgi:hypothetical protein
MVGETTTGYEKLAGAALDERYGWAVPVSISSSDGKRRVD